jgi:hypothetical protein
MQLSASQGIGTCKEPIASCASQEAKIVIDARLSFLASNSTHKKQRFVSANHNNNNNNIVFCPKQVGVG